MLLTLCMQICSSASLVFESSCCLAVFWVYDSNPFICPLQFFMHFIYNSDFVTSSINWVNTYTFYEWHLIKPSEVHKVERKQSSSIFSIWTLDSPLPLPFFSVALPFLLFLNSPSMTSVKRICFPASSLSTRTRRRVSRKQAMWTVSTEISTPAQCWARIGQQGIRTEVGTAPLDTADIRAYYRYSNTSGQWKPGACCVQWLDQALECLSNPCTLVVVVSLVALFLTDPQDNPDDMLSKGQSKFPM